MALIQLTECPKSVIDYYTQPPTKCRVLKVTATLLRDGSEQYTVTRLEGKDRWRYIDHQWRVDMDW